MLALVAVIYVPSVGVLLYGEIGRLKRAAAAKAVVQPVLGQAGEGV